MLIMGGDFHTRYQQIAMVERLPERYFSSGEAQAFYRNFSGTARAGVENNTWRGFKDLRGMRRNAKLLKRNDGARKGILIAPSKLPRISSVVGNRAASRPR